MPTIKVTKVEFEGRIEEREVIVEQERVVRWDGDAVLEIVGHATPRVDGIARVTGQATYTQDIALPGMLIGRFLRSPHPHARVTAIDSRAAEAMRGVWLVWHLFQPPPVNRIEGRELFAEELAYQGAEVAFVAAEDERTAEDALARIEVTYEALPFAPDLETAIGQDAPPVFAGEASNTIDPAGQVYARGDVEAGRAAADVVVDLTFSTPIAAHCCMETHGSVAQWEGDQVTVWHSTQSVWGTRSSVAEVLDIPRGKVRAICDYMGGGFGSKWGAERFTLAALLAARETRRPVKVVLDRAEEQLVAGYRPSSVQRVRLGARRNGTLTAIEHEAWVVTGAHGGGGSIIGGPAKDLYACPNVRTAVWAVRANADAGRAFRAPGYVEGTFALEVAMDALAGKLGMDPLDLRLANYAEASPARGIPYTLKGLRESYRLGAEAVGWDARRRTRQGRGPWRRGWGMASQIWGGGGGPPANAEVRLLPDGTADVMAGVQDLGTGTRTIVAQVAAEELGLPLDRVRVVIGDTLSTPFGPGSGGSVTLASITPAVREAAYDARRQLLDLAAYMLGVPDAGPEAFAISGGEITYLSDPQIRISFREVAAKMGDYMITGTGARGPNPDGKALNTFGAHFCQVGVNVETGQVRVLRVVAAHATGRIVNPLTAASQVYGGVTMGLGFATMEERVIDRRTGLQLTANLEGYKVPTIMDVPRIDAAFVDLVDVEANSVGSKGLGEPPIIPTPAAIANAVADAIGVRVLDLPITPDRVLAALARAREK
ncbi:MAG: xanthine dehydrogenase family protein molybdopterin-binding subunit [Anaerolineae bacterium]|nr:xanthine dehydrogenase family protein molybdopterin-binding subunit [Anaerolineae bacterium]